MLQGLFFLQGGTGKLINLGKGIYYQDENFALTFFLPWPKSQLSEEKTYVKKCQSAP